jgi:ribosomal protein S18 acetylase RimI-like enzyme
VSDRRRPEVVLATVADRERAVATQVTAFAADPFLRWMLPDPQQYLTVFPQILEHFAFGAFEWGTAWRSADHRGHALWQPPGAERDSEALGMVMVDAVDGDRLMEIGTVFAEINAHHPDGDHWYLPIIGVDPAAQGRGIGAALLQRSLETIDESHLPAFLESTNPRNVGLYVRFGFEPLAEVQLADSPVMTPMLRPAR